MDRLFVQRALLAIVGERFFEEGIERGKIDFAAAFGHEIAFRIDHAQAGPTVAVVGVPDFVVGVVDDRMLDFVAHNSLANAFGIVLGVELAGMDADHHDVVRIGPFQLFQFRQHVHAVDAAVGPEIEDHEFAAQGVQIDRLVGIEPPVPPSNAGAGTWRGKGCSVADPATESAARSPEAAGRSQPAMASSKAAIKSSANEVFGMRLAVVMSLFSWSILP